jgi:hypothetical protein
VRELIAAIALIFTGGVAHAEQALYVGAGVVYANVQDIFNFGDLFNISDVSWKAVLGYQPASYWAVEASYIDLGTGNKSLSHGTASVSANAVTGYVMGFVPLSETGADLYGKVGLAVGHVDAQSYTLYPSETRSDQSTHFAWGLGLRKRIGRFSARLEYEQFALAGSSGGAKVVSLVGTCALW